MPYKRQYVVVDLAKQTGDRAKWTVRFDDESMRNITSVRLVAYSVVDVERYYNESPAGNFTNGPRYPFYWLRLGPMTDQETQYGNTGGVPAYPLWLTSAPYCNVVNPSPDSAPNNIVYFNTERRAIDLHELSVEVTLPLDVTMTQGLVGGAGNPRLTYTTPQFTQLTLLLLVERESTSLGPPDRPAAYDTVGAADMERALREQMLRGNLPVEAVYHPRAELARYEHQRRM